jgi:hypothetical protein
MGHRGWSPTTEDEAAKLTLEGLNTRIASALVKLEMATNSAGRKSCLQHLEHLEQFREKLHGVPAPSRRSR